MATTNYNWTELTANQSNKEVTINSTFAEIEASFSATLAVGVDDSNAYTLTATQFRTYGVFVIDEAAGSPTANAAITLTCPTTKRGTFFVVNNTAFNVTVTISGQSKTPPVLATNTAAELNTDGSNIMAPA